MSLKYAWVVAGTFVLGLVQAACSPGARGKDDIAAAPAETTATPQRTAAAVGPPPAQPEAKAPVDTPPAKAEPAGEAGGAGGPSVSLAEYEGWRQYSVNCARCHGQDVLPNPVAANLLISLAPGGPVATYEKFAQVVSEGRPDRGMPAFKSIMTPEQIKSVYAYVKGRAEKRIPAGRPARPSS